MKRIAVLDSSYDLFLAYSWSNKPQGLSGHLFECIEYYFFLKDYLKVGIVICEEMPYDIIVAAIKSKYDFNDVEIASIMRDIFFFDLPQIIYGTNLLLVDGNFSKLKDKHLFFKKIMAFPCGDKCYQGMINVTAFQDYRIYGGCARHKNYVKKILFDRYKPIGPSTVDTNLLYITRGPREIPNSMYQEIETVYPGNFLLATNVEVSTLSNRFSVHPLPIDNLFEKFSTYIYTPISKKSDCSPRLIAECKWYGKRVEFYKIDYWDIDLGLYWRNYDIEHNFESLILRPGDPIVNMILQEIND